VVKNTLVLVGSSSEIATELQKICLDKNIDCISFTRNKKVTDNFNVIEINNYINDSDVIIEKLKTLSNIIIIFFNGALYENRPVKFPSKIEEDYTKLINYDIPIQLTKKISTELNNINKYVYLSSMSVVKLREKNYIYGNCKRSLENDVKKMGLPSILIIRFGKVFTKMSEGHKTPPFSLTPLKAAETILKNLNKSNVKYGNIGLFIIALIIKITPKKIIDLFKI